MNCPNCGQETVNINGRHVCLDCGIEALEQADFDNAGNAETQPASPEASNTAKAMPDKPMDKVETNESNQTGEENDQIEPVQIPEEIQPEEQKLETDALVQPVEEDLTPQAEEIKVEAPLEQEAVEPSLSTQPENIFPPQIEQEDISQSKEVNAEPSQEAILEVQDTREQEDSGQVPITSPIENEPAVSEMTEPLMANQQIGVNEEYHGPEDMFKVQPEINAGNPLFEEKIETNSNTEAKPFDTIMPTNSNPPKEELSSVQPNANVFESSIVPEGEMDVLPANMVSNGSMKKVIIITSVVFLVLIVLLIGYFKYSSIMTSLGGEEAIETPERIIE